jgi:hypothetical protein
MSKSINISHVKRKSRAELLPGSPFCYDASNYSETNPMTKFQYFLRVNSFWLLAAIYAFASGSPDIGVLLSVAMALAAYALWRGGELVERRTAQKGRILILGLACLVVLLFAPFVRYWMTLSGFCWQLPTCGASATLGAGNLARRKPQGSHQ